MLPDSTSAFIDDGYTEKGYIQPLDLVHPAVRFTYRPTLIEERGELRGKIALETKEARREQLTAAALAKHLLSWDVRDKSGNVVPTTANFVLRVKPALFDRLAMIVLFGNEGGDVDPEWTESEKRNHREEELASAVSGDNHADAVQEDREKN
jgi:hypothetical protein